MQKIETCKLDSVIAGLKIENVKLIKMDVEGAELEVIKGSDETIQKLGW
jgi:FkbM family methyltransferase